MENRLRNYFLLIRERKEVLKEIGESSGLKALFQSWTPERQEEFLDCLLYTSPSPRDRG